MVIATTQPAHEVALGMRRRREQCGRSIALIGVEQRRRVSVARPTRRHRGTKREREHEQRAETEREADRGLPTQMSSGVVNEQVTRHDVGALQARRDGKCIVALGLPVVPDVNASTGAGQPPSRQFVKRGE